MKCYDHLHSQAEFAVAIKGKLIIKHEMAEVELKENEGMLVMPYELHGYKSEVGTEAVIIEFNKLAFEEIAGRQGWGGIKFNISSSTIAYILSEISKEKKTSVFLKSVIYPILANFFDDREENGDVLKNSVIYQDTLAFVDENFGENITLKTVSEKIGCSYVYLSRVFSNKIGMSFTSYLNRYRILKSVADLKTTDMNITEIAYKNGFGSLRSYNREFKKIFNMTPREYRIN